MTVIRPKWMHGDLFPSPSSSFDISLFVKEEKNGKKEGEVEEKKEEAQGEKGEEKQNEKEKEKQKEKQQQRGLYKILSTLIFSTKLFRKRLELAENISPEKLVEIVMKGGEGKDGKGVEVGLGRGSLWQLYCLLHRGVLFCLSFYRCLSSPSFSSSISSSLGGGEAEGEGEGGWPSFWVGLLERTEESVRGVVGVVGGAVGGLVSASSSSSSFSFPPSHPSSSLGMYSVGGRALVGAVGGGLGGYLGWEVGKEVEELVRGVGGVCEAEREKEFAEGEEEKGKGKEKDGSEGEFGVMVKLQNLSFVLKFLKGMVGGGERGRGGGEGEVHTLLLWEMGGGLVESLLLKLKWVVGELEKREEGKEEEGEKGEGKEEEEGDEGEGGGVKGALRRCGGEVIDFLRRISDGDNILSSSLTEEMVVAVVPEEKKKKEGGEGGKGGFEVLEFVGGVQKRVMGGVLGVVRGEVKGRMLAALVEVSVFLNDSPCL